MSEARPFEEYKEMIQDMRKEEMIKGLYDLSKNIIEKDKEIERLNNRIDKATEDINDFMEKCKYYDDYTIDISILNYWLEILKGEDKE